MHSRSRLSLRRVHRNGNHCLVGAFCSRDIACGSLGSLRWYCGGLRSSSSLQDDEEIGGGGDDDWSEGGDAYEGVEATPAGGGGGSAGPKDGAGGARLDDANRQAQQRAAIDEARPPALMSSRNASFAHTDRALRLACSDPLLAPIRATSPLVSRSSRLHALPPQVADLLGLSQDQASLLLHHCKWDSERLLTAYMENAEKARKRNRQVLR